MGGNHRHAHVGVRPARVPAAILLISLFACAVGAIIGLVTLWPDADKVAAVDREADFAVPGVIFLEADVEAIKLCNPGEQQNCPLLTATLTEGEEEGQSVTVAIDQSVATSGLKPGDQVRLMRLPGGGELGVHYAFDSIVRGGQLLVLALAFVLIVALVARLRGILALIGLCFGGAIVLYFMIPALLSGEHGVLVALTGSTAIMFIVLYLAHGPSVRTSAALAGTLIGVGATAGIGQLAVHAARLTGVADDESAAIGTYATEISMQGLLLSALVIAGLGVINDITITQASSVWELRAAAPSLSRGKLFTSGMRIGRDHIASTIYTIVFAYTGASLAVLMLVSMYDRSMVEMVSTELFAQEIVFTLASGIGLVLAVPATTLIAAFTVKEPRIEPTGSGAATPPASDAAVPA